LGPTTHEYRRWWISPFSPFSTRFAIFVTVGDKPRDIARLASKKINYEDGFRQRLAIGKQIPTLDSRHFIANLKPLIDALVRIN
jgi:hypothetical protein